MLFLSARGNNKGTDLVPQTADQQRLLLRRSLQPETRYQTPDLAVLQVHPHPFLLILASDLACRVLCGSAQQVDPGSKGCSLSLRRGEDRRKLGNEVSQEVGRGEVPSKFTGCQLEC